MLSSHENKTTLSGNTASSVKPISRDIKRLLKPSSIAIVGASENSGSVGGAVLANLAQSGFDGDIHLVSRTRCEILGRACIHSIAGLPKAVDTVVLAVPAEAVLSAVQDCVNLGVGGVVTFADGFAEMGEAGVIRQISISAVARENGLALNGPNCAGFINYRDRVPLTFNRYDRSREYCTSGVAIIAQSGAVVANIDDGLYARGLGVTYAISTGNEAALGIEDFLEYVLSDSSTRIVVIFAEQIRDGLRFLALVKTARQLGTPIILMHSGRTQRSRESAQSHTGAMVGDHAVMRTILRYEGVRMVDTLDELFDVTVLLARWPGSYGNGIMVMTNSGALRSIVFDSAEAVGANLPQLSDQTKAQLQGIFPRKAVLDNPLDLLTLGLSQPDIYHRAGKMLLDDSDCDGFVFVSSPGPWQVQVAKAKSMIPLIQDSLKPIAFVMLGDEAPLSEEFVKLIQDSKIPIFRSLDRALRAMSALMVPKPLEPRIVSPRRSSSADYSAISSVNGPMAEFESKKVLASWGLIIPHGGLARSPQEAQSIAARIGFPVALKAQARALTHKSECGGVALNIGDADALHIAWHRIQSEIHRLQPGVELDGMLVEVMSARGVEMIVGARRDPDWGVAMIVGLGGVTAEVVGDTRLLSPNLERDAIVSEIKQLKGVRLLQGFRGQPACDVNALANAVGMVADLMLEEQSVSVVEINPLMLYADGQGACALDGLIIVN